MLGRSEDPVVDNTYYQLPKAMFTLALDVRRKVMLYCANNANAVRAQNLQH